MALVAVNSGVCLLVLAVTDVVIKAGVSLTGVLFLHAHSSSAVLLACSISGITVV